MAFNLLTKQHIDIAGLDIGSDSVKLVCLKKGHGNYTLSLAHQEPLAMNDDKPSPEAVTDAIRKCLKAGGARGKNVVCGVSGSEVVVRAFKFGPLPEQAIEQAVNMEARQVCPFDVNQSVVDFQLIQTPEHECSSKNTKVQPRHGVMTAATERIICEQTGYIDKAGGSALMVDVNALALLNCLNLFAEVPPQETVAVIDIGAGATNVVIYGQDGLPFVRDITVAGNQVIGDIAAKTNLSEQAVTKALAENTEQAGREQLLLAMNNAIRPLINAINETLRFYSLQEKGAGVQQIYLCGGYALLETFVEFITDALSVPLTVLNPFERMKHDGHSDPTIIQNGPMYAIAAGLAVRALS
jgi:type IV pilus assembly protein PilM